MRASKYYVENTAQLETWKMVNENKVSYCKTWHNEKKSCFPLGQTYKPTILN